MSGVNNEFVQLLRDIRDTQVTQAETMGRIEGTLASLSGPEGRVTKLERKNDRDAWMSYGKHALTVMLAIAGHKLTKVMGWDL